MMNQVVLKKLKDIYLKMIDELINFMANNQ